ncbi:MAG: PEP-CTERM sorting domain-containing protein [Lentisphaerae bacterium]|nr:PEP-CTERM sorting domain-containing protein [Lentisphaerota bacterium]
MVRCSAFVTVAWFGLCVSAGAVSVYVEDFGGATLTNRENGYVGGFYGNQLALGQWFGSGRKVAVGAGVLTVLHDTGSTRFAGVVLDPGIFGGQAGRYLLSFDVKEIALSQQGVGNPAMGVTHRGRVDVWQGHGYDVENDSADSLWANSFSGTLTPKGNASASRLESLTFGEAGDGYTLAFDYDGSSAVALFFGADKTAYPHLTVVYDNIVIAPTHAPEPSTALMTALGLGMVCWRRRRRGAPRA